MRGGTLRSSAGARKGAGGPGAHAMPRKIATISPGCDDARSSQEPFSMKKSDPGGDEGSFAARAQDTGSVDRCRRESRSVLKRGDRQGR
jgi:hypothetical protein